jgi:ubiquinone/menaquinone biosynthesis C-methylase UbiE
MSPAREDYTHGHHQSVVRSHQWRTLENSAAYLQAHLVGGMSVLDVGCGPGTITCDLGAAVSPGTVIGIDQAGAVLDAGRAEATSRSLDNVTFAEGDVYQLGFEDDSFDVVHAHQVLQHLGEPVAALVEMRRVCRPGGVVACRDADYSAMRWYPADSGLEQWLDLYRQVARSNRGEPDAGPRLLAWAHAAGFETVDASASAWCFATEEDRRWWGESWAERITTSALAKQAVDQGRATPADLEELAAAWRRWQSHPDAWFGIIHGEILCWG